MIQTCNIINKNNDQKVKKCKDMQKYIKPLYCSCCDTTVFYTSLDDHNKSEHHVIAQRIRNRFPGQIDNIKQKVVEVKMMIKYIKKTFNNDSSLNSEELGEQIKKIDDKTRYRLKRKSETYTRELEYRADMYEKTKGIEKIVNSIKTCNRRLTKVQINKYNNYLIKYPDNELLLSIQHLVPKNDAILVMDNVPKNNNN
jgi:hypothetical protein